MDENGEYTIGYRVHNLHVGASSLQPDYHNITGILSLDYWLNM